MNRNEQVNGEKMWEYIRNIGKAIRRYRKEIATVVCSLTVPFLVASCAPGEWEEFWTEQRREWDKIAEESNREGGHHHDHYDPYAWERMSWRTQREIEKLKKIEEQQRLEGARIRAHTQKMLLEMELKRKLREQR